MTTTLNASTAGAGGFIATSDNSGVLALQTAGTTAVTIDTSQKVGIGTTSPSSILNLKAATPILQFSQDTGNSDQGIKFQASGFSSYGSITHNAVTGVMKYQSGNSAGDGYYHVWVQDGTERARINTSGYFKASADGTYLGASGSYHELRGAGSNNYELIITNTNASPASEYIQDIRFNASSPNNGNARFLACTDTTNEKAAILSSGGFLSRNNSYGTYSDIKLKENIVNASPKLADVMRLQVRNFNFKTNPQEKQIGFIAQEFEQIFPAMVDESQDRAQDGTVLDETTKSIKTSVLVPILVKAIQELKAINDTQAETLTQQTEAINALTARVVALESRGTV